MNEIGLGDYLRAVAALDDSDRTCRQVAAALGLAPAIERASPAAPRTEQTGGGERKPPELVDERVPDRGGGGEAHAEIAVDGGDDIAVVAGPAATPTPAPTERVPVFSRRRIVLPLEPLFAPPRSRALLSSLLASVSPTGEIDEAVVVDRFARLEPITVLPRLSRPTLARGVQIIVDVAEGMMPFRRDQGDLLERVDRLISDGLTAVVTCDGDPLVTWSAVRNANVDYTPPPAGTPVLALTDLGIRALATGRPRLADRWRALADKLRRAGVPFVALVPYPPERWPAELAARIAMVSWDRGARVSHVQRMARVARSR